MQEPRALVANQPSADAGAGWQRSLARLPGSGWVFVYVAAAIGCQLALLFSQLAPARIVFRSAAFGASLVLLFAVPGRARVHHAARPLALAVIAIISLSALHPSGSTPLSIIAHWCFYVAVLAPLFWVARVDVSETTLIRLLLVYWLFASLSSLFGVLQAMFPGRFQPSVVTLFRPDQIVWIKLASGEWVPRPMGLTDTPGGAGSAGLYATLLGLGVSLARPFRYARAAGVLSMIVGTACIYLSQVRAMVVMLAICVAVLLGLFALAGRLSRLALALAIGVGITLGGFYLAFALAGRTVSDRLSSLIDSDPGTVYERNRGHFVEYAFSELLPEYPLGAGLGRWGTMNQYFGNSEDSLWSEVQWSGWIFDGGFLMLLAYPIAVIAILVTLVRIVFDRRGDDFGLWAGVVVAYGFGTLALTFSYPIFMSTGGIDFWLISAVAVQAARQRITEPAGDLRRPKSNGGSAFPSRIQARLALAPRHRNAP